MKYHIKEKILTMHGAYQIFDENDNECYHVKQNMISLTNKTHLYDMEDNEVASIHSKVVSLHAVHYLEMADGTKGEIGEKKLLQMHDNFKVGGFDWEIEGDMFAHNFRILNKTGNVIAESREAWFSIGDLFSVEVYDDAQAEKVLAVLIAISEIHRDKQRALRSNN